jgi:hypothetical protein
MAPAQNSKLKPCHVNPTSLHRSFRTAGFSGILLLLLSACMAQQIGGPVAPKGDRAAGLLTLPSGRTVPVYPSELAYTGKALFRWPDGRDYEGDWSQGQPQGMGSETVPDGESYRGTWRNGQRHGHGELNRADGSRYVGDFADGLRDGEGSERSNSGLYRGTWTRDMPDGEGAYFGNDGSSYRGQWRNGKRDGVGRYNDGRGSSYDGDWSADSPNGFGNMDNADGSHYHGQLSRNLRNGYGRLASDGFIYEGTWLAGKRHGFGRADTPDGGNYLGEWQNGNRHGSGRATNADGGYHDGEWQHDQCLGPGVRVDATGIEIIGVWNGDIVSSGMLVLPSGQRYAGLMLRKNLVVAGPLITWLENAAQNNDPYAQFFLGLVFSDYLDPPPDRQRARALFLAAARSGVPEAAFRAAMLSPEPDPENARIRLLAQAADASHAEANALLGEYYATGRFVSRDTSAAVTYLTRASDLGNLAARNNLAWILATYPNDLIRDGDRAVALIAPIARLYDNWQHLDTLAAAYAETGNFELAVRTAQRALDNLSASPSSDLAPDQISDMQKRLQLYQQNQPFREYGKPIGNGSETADP